jgi:hypothetical protein
MPKGEKRKGGRPTGAASLVTRKRAHQYSQDGDVLPLDVMMSNMRFWHRESQRLEEKIIELANTANLTPDEKKGAMKALGAFLAARDKAQECARDAAPYVHPRLAAMVPKPDSDDDKLPPVAFDVTFTTVAVEDERHTSPSEVAEKMGEEPGTALIPAE